MPNVDVSADVAAINAGNALRSQDGGTIYINGRSYGAHYETHRLFPRGGEGTITVNPGEYLGIAVLQTHGNSSRAIQIMNNMKISKTDIDSAIAIWDYC